MDAALTVAFAFDPLEGLIVFVLATLLGLEVIQRVPSLLHTPLMSGGNAICGIIVVGTILVAGTSDSMLAVVLALIGTAFATVNVVGGFLVTDRMMRMFRRAPPPPSDRA